jgi:AAA domain
MEPATYTLEQFEAALVGVEEKRASKRGAGLRETKTGSRRSLDDPQLHASRPELVIEALEAWPNNAETNPLHEDFVRAMAATKSALGPKREDYYGHVLNWALGFPKNDGKYVRRTWDSIKDAEVGADWLFSQARPYGFLGDVQDYFFADPAYPPESFDGLDADGVRGRIDELLILKFGWADAYKEVCDYLEMMGVIDLAEVEALIAKRAPAYGIAIAKEGAEKQPKFLLLDDLNSLSEPSDFIEGLLCDGQLSVLYGDANVGKSFIALDFALRVALGWKCHGREVDRGLVVYIAGEGAGGMRRRVDAFLKHHGIHEIANVPFALIPYTVNFRDQSNVDDLVKTIREAAARLGVPVRWVIVDTLSRALAGGNENAPDDMGALVRGADQVRLATGAHLTFVHHTGKDDSKGARGHSLLRAAVDTEIEVWRSKGTEGAIGVTVTKQRDLEIGRGFAFKLLRVELGTNAREKLITSCVVQATTVRPALTETEQQAYDTLTTLLTESEETVVPMADWQKAVLDDEGFRAGQKKDTRSRAFRRACKNLKNKGFIECSGTSVRMKKP